MINQSIFKTPAGERAVMALYDSMLERWPVPCDMFSVSTRHGVTFTIASGNQSAPPLILLHGAGSNSLTWASDVIQYSQQYRVFAVDLLGEPGRSAPNRPAWDSLAYAEWLEDVLDALRIDKAALIGFSQGGWTAIKYAVYQPTRVEKLVLLSPGGIVPDKLSFVFQAIPLALMGRWGVRRVNQMLVAGQAISAEVDDALALIMTHFKTRIGALPIFHDAELQALHMPVLLLMGDQDVLRDARKISARMRQQVHQLSVTIIPKGGHALMNTTKYILPFLSAPLLNGRLSYER